MILNADQLTDGLVQMNGSGQVAQVGIDLTVEDIKRIRGGEVLTDRTLVRVYEPVDIATTAVTIDDKGANTYEERKGWQLEPGNTYSLTFTQGCKLNSNTTGFIHHRSSVLRCGSVIISGVYDPGFEVDQMGAVLVCLAPIFIEKGARVAQLVVHENHSATLYDGQWQKEKDLK